MNKAILTSALFLTLITHHVCATTWDEPWQDSVITNSESFVKAEIKDSGSDKISITVTKQLAGEKVPDELTISAFNMLDFGSYSHSPEFHFDKGDEYYFFIKKSETNDQYSIATPTAGFAFISDNGVHATYTHSYYQALIPQDIYEMSMQSIFQHVHNEKCDEQQVNKFINESLSIPPQALSNAESDKEAGIFFKQHAALESFRYFGKPENEDLLNPFLKTNDRFVQISAVRALAAINTPNTHTRLLEFIKGDNDRFAQVLALWELDRLDAKECLPELKKIVSFASEEETGFGGNIMDPRIGTRFPSSVKSAMESLIKKWELK
jgi:hypothetical protein